MKHPSRTALKILAAAFIIYMSLIMFVKLFDIKPIQFVIVKDDDVKSVRKLDVNTTVKETGESTNNGRQGTNKPKLLCWILADPTLMYDKVVHQKETWAKRCEKLLVMSSKEDTEFPAVGLDVPPGRDHIALKVRAAWQYIHKHYIDEYDFFIKTDPDTYVVMENLLDFLSDKNPSDPYFFGHRFKYVEKNVTYMAGGPGLIITKESLNRLVTKAFVDHSSCIPDGQGEDWKICKCMQLVGCKAQDTRDKEGKERFLVLEITANIHRDFPAWYKVRDVDGELSGDMCCSEYPIAYHYVSRKNMYVLEYWLYHTKVHGKETSFQPWPKILKVPR